MVLGLQDLKTGAMVYDEEPNELATVVAARIVGRQGR